MPTISLNDTKVGFVAHLQTFPGGTFERNRSHSRDVDLGVETKPFNALVARTPKSPQNPAVTSREGAEPA